MNAILLFLVMSVFFGGMYIYSYMTTTYKDRLKEKAEARKYEERQQKFKRLKVAMKNGRNVIKQKYAKAEERRAQIKEELKRLKSQNIESIA